MSTLFAVPSAAVSRVLMIRPRFLGDVCLTLPALEAVRAACPQAEIGYVVERESAPLLEGDPRLARLFTAPRRPELGDTIRLIRELREFAPEVVMDFFCNPRTAIWSWLSGARVRVGYPNKGWRSALYTHHARPRTLSAIGFHLASLAALGWNAGDKGAIAGAGVATGDGAHSAPPRLHLGADARESADAALRELSVPGDAVLLGLHPGARWPTRRWAPERFAELANRFLDHERRGLVLITAGPDEGESVGPVLAALPPARCRPIVGWPLARFVALQARCAAFVCGDTGPMHTAVAAGTPTLGLFSRNRPAMFFPYDASHGHRAHYARVECSPCHRDQCADLRCLTRLEVEPAWHLLREMLELQRHAAPIAASGE